MGGRGSSGVKSRAANWSLARVGRLASGNRQGMTVEQEYQAKEVRGEYSAQDFAVARQAGFAHPRDYQASITRDIAARGQVNPARVSEGALDEGFHRYAAARQLGKRSMAVRES